MHEQNQETGSETPGCPQPAAVPYFLKAVLATLVIAALVQFVDRSGVWLFALLCLLLAVPILCREAYFRAIRRTHWLSLFRAGGLGQRWLSGIWTRLIVSTLTALVLAFVMLFRLRTLSWQEWVICATAIPAFWAAALLSRRFVGEADARFRVFVRAKSASWLTVIFLLVLYGGALVFVIPDPTLSDSAPGMRQPANSQIVSAIVAELDALHEGWRALEALVLGHVSGLGTWGRMAAFVVFITGNIAFFFACASMLACFFIPPAEFARGFYPATTSLQPPAPTFAGGVFTSAFAAVFVSLLLFSSAVQIEAVLKQLPPERRPMHQASEWVVSLKRDLQSRPPQPVGPLTRPGRQANEVTAAKAVHPELPPAGPPRQPKVMAEKIGDRYVRPGTIKKIQDARLGFLSSQGKHLAILEQTTNRAFDLMEKNVDAYLDWYYSLPGEYTRILKLLVGTFEGFLTDQLSSYISQGEPFEQLEKTYSGLLETDSVQKTRYQNKIEAIIEENLISIDDLNRIVVTQEIDDADSVISYMSVATSFKARLATTGLLGTAGTGGGAAAGAKLGGLAGKKVSAVVGKNMATGVAKAVTNKLAAKGTLKIAAKLAAKSGAKLAASKAASGVGMVIGGAIGSIIPFAGTAAGAIAGSALGALVFVGADAAFLRLDEAMNRDKFRAQLLEALNPQRQKMLEAIRGAGH